ncbi:MAG: ABC-type Na+ efflux pump permease subunit [Verrucomicrobiales bacterium]|jgi:ABC-type Na+ efflux pump permease subunit
MRIWVIARNTLTQLIRMRAFYFLLIFSLLILGASLMIQNFTEDTSRQLKIMKDMSFFAMSIFCIIFSIVATANLIPTDIEDRTLYTILAKPVPRFEYLIGKYLGGMFVIFLSIAVMTAILYGTLYIRQQALMGEHLAFMEAGAGKADEMEVALRKLQRDGPSVRLLPAVLAIGLQASVLGAITLCISTFASSGLFTVVVAFVVFFVGYIEPVIVEYWRSSSTSIGGIANAFTAVIGWVFPNFQNFNLVDGVVAGDTLPQGVIGKIIAMAMTYVSVYLLAGYLFFAEKEL